MNKKIRLVAVILMIAMVMTSLAATTKHVDYSPKEFTGRLLMALQQIDDDLTCDLSTDKDGDLELEVSCDGDVLGWIFFFDADADYLQTADRRIAGSIYGIRYGLLLENAFEAGESLAAVLAVCDPDLDGSEIASLSSDLLVDYLDDEDGIEVNGNHYWLEMAEGTDDMVLLTVILR